MLKANSIQLVGDLIISLIGYFYWDWNIYFIVLFMLFDVIARAVLLEFKVKKIAEFRQSKGSVSAILINAVSVFVLIIVAHLALFILQPNLELASEFIRFLTYEDMGLAQGILLIPLIALMVYTEYKMQFIRFVLYQRQEERGLRTHHQRDIFAAILLSSCYLIVGLFVSINESILVFSLLGIILTYRIIQFKLVK